MARRWFKERWTQIVPWAIERSTYVLCASLALLLLFWQWRPIGIQIWSVENAAGRAVLWTLFGAGWATVLTVTFLINHFDLFGLRQVWLPLIGRPYTHVSFRTPLPYKFVRHPLYFGFLLGFWMTPTMTLAHLVFAVATTAYILLAIQFEERDLMREHPEYAEYRRRVPMIVPALRQARRSGVRRARRDPWPGRSWSCSAGPRAGSRRIIRRTRSANTSNALVKVVREATERFKDVSAAEREGYGLMFGCVSGGDWGAMGLHYVNLPLVLDGDLDAAQPEIVIYEPTPSGRLRIIGADYLVFAADWDKKHPGEPPQLLGQLLHFFEAPNRFGLPPFYTLHVWAWKENPAGDVRQLAPEGVVRRVQRAELTDRFRRFPASRVPYDRDRGVPSAPSVPHQPALLSDERGRARSRRAVGRRSGWHEADSSRHWRRPASAKGKFGSAQVIVSHGLAYVIDCGDGVARQMAFAGVPLPSIRHVFITHQHSDHTADYGNLILLAWTAGLSTRVDTWGPPPLERMTKLFFEMNASDINTRVTNEGRVPILPLVHAHERLVGGAVMSDDNVKVTSTLVDHPPIVAAFAYRFDARDRSIVISGDTAPSQSLVKLAAGADVLVHSVMYPAAIDRLVARVPNAAALKASILAHQTSAEDAGRVAQEAGVKTLVLSHLVPPDDPEVTEAMWLEAARRHFRGTVIVGRDLLEV